jgi:predicted RNase H-like nuclease
MFNLSVSLEDLQRRQTGYEPENDDMDMVKDYIRIWTEDEENHVTTDPEIQSAA